MNFNPYSRSHLGNPHPVYAALREERPVHRPPAILWAISRFDDVEAALREWPVFSSATGITLDGFSGLKPMIIAMDPPRQAELRRVLQNAFTAKRIAAQEGLIRHIARAPARGDTQRRRRQPGVGVQRAVSDHGDRRDAVRRSERSRAVQQWSNGIITAFPNTKSSSTASTNTWATRA